MGLYVLLVDDEPDSLHLLQTVLEYAGALVTGLTSAPDAVRTLERLAPDVMVADIAMPGRDGYWLIREVRAREAAHGRRVPVIALTAHGETHGPPRTLAAGFDMHLHKPVDPWDLCRAIASLARRP